MVQDRVNRLTEQQRICLRLVYAHLTSKEIAPRLGIEPNSVDQHIKAAMRTLGVSERRTAARILAEHEHKPDRVEMREIQTDFVVLQPPAKPPVRHDRKGRKYLRRMCLGMMAIVAAALAIGILLAAVEAWLRLFRI